MVKADRSWPRPRHLAWQSPHLNSSNTMLEPSLCGLPSYLNSSTCIFPAVSAFPGSAAPVIPSSKTELANEVQGFLHYPNSEPCLKETHTGGAMQNAIPASLQRKLLIFDHSGNKTRFFYSLVPLVRSPILAASKIAYDVKEGGEVSNMGQKKNPTKDSLPEESDKDRIVQEASEMHEDTEEINALLYSESDGDDDDDEVTSTGRSPLATKRTYLMQELFEDTKEGVASSDWPNKRQKLIDGGYNKSSPPVGSAISVRLNKTCECVSDAESKYSSGWAYSAGKTEEDNSILVGNIQLKKNRIRESLRALENLIPGAKGKEPLLVIDGAIEYLKSLMSQTGNLGSEISLRH